MGRQKGALTKARRELHLGKNHTHNILLHAKRKLNFYLKKYGKFKPYRQSFLDKVELFRELTDEKPYHLNKKEAYVWLMSIWISGENPDIKKADPINFYFKDEWRALRVRVLQDFGSVCMKCGGNQRISVDHIKPRSLYPELELEYDNLQVLCTPCNSSKSNRFIVDYRSLQPF